MEGGITYLVRSEIRRWSVRKPLNIKGLCPYHMDRVTMTCMGWAVHASGIPTNDMLDILPTNGVVRSDLEATIENLEPVNSRLGCCYNELHNVFSVFWLKCVLVGDLNKSSGWVVGLP